jgi:MFS family permease
MTTNRWVILAVLFLARTAMAFQFQSIAALSPLLIADFGVGLADIGFLIGLYFAPGVVFALPGGAIGARFGDKQIVAFGMILMLVGGAVIATTQSWNVLCAARVVVGAGGVILNVLMTKMVVDWFAGKELSTAMAIFINSWPIGIAMALLILPVTAQVGGIAFAWWGLCAFVAGGLVLFVVFYQAAPDAPAVHADIARVAFPIAALVLASVVWALYNTALSMVFSFGPAFLTQEGYSLTNAGSLTSLFMVIFAIALPVGGIIADRTGRKDVIILISLLSFAALMPIAVFMPSSAFVLFCILGVLFALGAGPTMTLPAEVLSPQSRAIGMGVFFTIYYALMMFGPRVGGGVAEATNDAGAAILVGAAMSLVAAIALGAFRRIARP